MKKTLSLLLVLFCSLALRAERFEYNNIFYNTLSDSTVEVTTQTEWSFAGYNHESLAIPQTVEYQGKTYRVIRIGQAAFYEYTSLTSITIPNTVTSIGIGAFYKCEKLDNLTIPASVTTIEKEAFLNCTGLTSFKFDHSSSLTTIGEKAFAACCSLRAIDIPYRVTSIGQGAFQECQALKTVYLTENLGSIENYVFTKSTVTRLNGAPATALGSVTRSAANGPGRHNLRSSAELAHLRPKSAAENTSEHKENSLTAYSSGNRYN